MPDIVTVTINPAVDLAFSTDRIEPERKLRCSAPKRDPGGGGINVARAAYRLGANVAAIYPTGGALGNLLHRLLDREGLSSIVTPSHVDTRENFTVYENETGRQYRFVMPGSTLHHREWEAILDKLRTVAERPRFVIASGSLPNGVPDDFFAQVARIAKTLGAKPVVDSSRAALKAALAEGVALVKPNVNELSEYVGRSLDNDEARVAACRSLIAEGAAEAVALTLGADGSMLVTRDAAWRARKMDVEAISVVGAGDSFLGGIMAGLAADRPWPDAFRLGVAAGTAAVMMPGTELCRETDVKRLMPQVKIEAIA